MEIFYLQIRQSIKPTYFNRANTYFPSRCYRNLEEKQPQFSLVSAFLYRKIPTVCILSIRSTCCSLFRIYWFIYSSACHLKWFSEGVVETKTLVDGGTQFGAGLAAGGVERGHSRFTLLNVAHEISNIEKKCKRTSAPFDQRLNHLRNQHPGLEQMFGVPPPASSPTLSLLQMLRAQRL